MSTPTFTRLAGFTASGLDRKDKLSCSSPYLPSCMWFKAWLHVLFAFSRLARLGGILSPALAGLRGASLRRSYCLNMT
jgi:hypothetical protein